MGIRQEKFSRQVQRDIGTLLQSKSHDWFDGQLITVSEVKATPDLGYVKTYLSLYMCKNKQVILENIEFHKREIRHLLAQKIKNEVRKIPELEFFEDHSLEYVNKMDHLLDSLKKERETREDDHIED